MVKEELEEDFEAEEETEGSQVASEVDELDVEEDESETDY